jgi:hypothetical protein
MGTTKQNTTIETAFLQGGVISRLPHIEIGDKIKLYGRITTVVGFNVLWNDALEDYEIILLTTGRGDPFKRSLKQIELVQND